jgi:hypothetical protein
LIASSALGGFLEECCAARLACRKLDRGGHRSMVHAFEQNDPTAIIDDRETSRPDTNESV